MARPAPLVLELPSCEEPEPHAASANETAGRASSAAILMPPRMPRRPESFPAHEGACRTAPAGQCPSMLRRLAPWLILFEVLRAGRDHWDRLDPGDRAAVFALMRRTHGNPRNLTDADRRALRDLGRRLRLGRLGLPLGSAAIVGRRRRRRGR